MTVIIPQTLDEQYIVIPTQVTEGTGGDIEATLVSGQPVCSVQHQN